tara:strand:- start:31 stop:336 length:306 start_codon:yes stop_codon:yes gene_type:complete
MKILKSKLKNILREFDYKLEEYCYNDKRKYVVVQAIGKYDRDILWFMPRDEYDSDIKADQQMFTYWTSLNYTTLVDIYQTIRAEGFYWLNLVRKELYKKVK